MTGMDPEDSCDRDTQQDGTPGEWHSPQAVWCAPAGLERILFIWKGTTTWACASHSDAHRSFRPSSSDADCGQSMARLLDQFSELFSLGLAIDASDAAVERLTSRAQAQDEARMLLKAVGAGATASGTSSKQFEIASFAVIAWLDEVMSRVSRWTDNPAPLQAQIFNSRNAHSEFFHHLSGLPADADEAREVYWYAMACGFTGQYYFESGDEGELGKLKDLHGQQLLLPPTVLARLDAERLTPQPYTRPAPSRGRAPERRARAARGAAAAIALLVSLGFLMQWFLAGPRATPPTAAERLNTALTSYACADLNGTVDDAGNAHVSGFVPVPEDIARVERDVRTMAGVRVVNFDIGLRVWPHCEVVDLLKPYQARNRDPASGLRMTAPSARHGRQREGDGVVIEVVAPNYDSYLRVDYYTADGAVQHLNRGDPSASVPSGTKVQFGKDIPASWLVSPPFGTVLVAALSSPAPFVEIANRPPYELASAYLLRLRDALSTNKGGDRVIAKFLFLETAER